MPTIFQALDRAHVAIKRYMLSVAARRIPVDVVGNVPAEWLCTLGSGLAESLREELRPIMIERVGVSMPWPPAVGWSREHQSLFLDTPACMIVFPSRDRLEVRFGPFSQTVGLEVQRRCVAHSDCRRLAELGDACADDRAHPSRLLHSA